MAKMNEEALANWILRRLGGGRLRLELTQEHVCDAIEDARRWFAARKGVKRARLLTITASQNNYTLPDDVDTVLSCEREATSTDLTLIFTPYSVIDDRVPSDVFGSASSGGLYSMYVQLMQYTEMARQIVSAEPDWRQEDRTLWLFPAPNNGTKFRIYYKSNEVTIEQLNERDHDLVKRYALAVTKGILGRIRSKYGSFPGAQNGSELDGQTLLAESAEEVEMLKQEIYDSGFPAGFLMG